MAAVEAAGRRPRGHMLLASVSVQCSGGDWCLVCAAQRSWQSDSGAGETPARLLGPRPPARRPRAEPASPRLRDSASPDRTASCVTTPRPASAWQRALPGQRLGDMRDRTLLATTDRRPATGDRRPLAERRAPCTRERQRRRLQKEALALRPTPCMPALHARAIAWRLGALTEYPQPGIGPGPWCAASRSQLNLTQRGPDLILELQSGRGARSGRTFAAAALHRPPHARHTQSYTRLGRSVACSAHARRMLGAKMRTARPATAARGSRLEARPALGVAGS